MCAYKVICARRQSLLNVTTARRVVHAVPGTGTNAELVRFLVASMMRRCHALRVRAHRHEKVVEIFQNTGGNLLDNGTNQRTQRLPAMLFLENEYEIPEFSYERKERTVEGAKKSPACRSARRRNNIYGERNGKRQSCDFWSGSREHTNKTHRNYRQNTKRCESAHGASKIRWL